MIFHEADFMKTKSYCEAILKHKRHNYLENYGDSRCKIGLFSQDNFEVLLLLCCRKWNILACT